MESIEIVVAAEDVELAGGLMWAWGVEGIEERVESDDPAAPTVRLIAGVPAEFADDVAAALVDRWPVARGQMQPELWADSWRPYAKAVRIRDQLVVQPPWIDPIARPGDVVISLDPGRAWGHGAHPSTVLVAEELVEIGSLARLSLLDVGCGSGLLAIVAAVQGAARVVAVDIDPGAVEATLSNAAVNGVDHLIEVSTNPVATIGGTFNLVVANIGLGVLRELAGTLVRLVADGGALVLSGLLDDQVDDAVAAYPTMIEVRRRDLDGWGVVVLAHSANL